MRQISIFLAGMFASLATMPFVAPQGLGGPSAAYSARETAAEEARDLPTSGLLRAEDGLFYIDGRLPKGSIRFLVDTGASHVVLSHRDAKTVGPYVPTGEAGAVLTAGGPVAVDWIVIKQISFEGHSIKNLRAAVPRRDTGISLLGQNALAQFESLSIDGDKLTLSR